MMRYRPLVMEEYINCPECDAALDPDAEFCSECGAAVGGFVFGGPTPYRRHAKVAGGALGVALFCILLAGVFALVLLVREGSQITESIDPYAGIPGTTASPVTTGGGGSGSSSVTATSSQAATVVRPRAAESSSSLKPTATNDYRATNLLDGDPATAWNEGVDGTGAGEWVKFEFSDPVMLSRIEIANGYQKDEVRFGGNVRVRSMKIEYSSGVTQVVTLRDIEGFQAVAALPSETEWIKFTILSVYPGYEWDDAALSEIRFLASAGQQ